jgi:lipoprotein-anchoring transpeptidase ErfK/SrfK
MSEDEVERTLRDALDARARGAIGDAVGPPPPRFVTGVEPVRRHRRARLLAPLAAAAAVIGVVASVAALQQDSAGGKHDVGVGAQSSTAAPSSAARSSTSAATASALSRSATIAAGLRPVHIKTLNSDGATYGVGMPVVAFLSAKITSGKELQAATRTTVNGKPLTGAWYFAPSSHHKGYPVEAHWRPQTYWPAHAKVHVDIATDGLSAGEGWRFDDSLTLDFTTGGRTVAVVDDKAHKMTVSSDGKPLGEFPVSLGMSQSPTTHGIKVIMEKGLDISMRGPGYFVAHVQFTQRLTYGGEYLHAAPWNVANIKSGIDTSNGCTNLLPTDAKRLYSVLEVGDVVEYPNATGPAMRMGDGFGDWNVPWNVWQTGGLVPVR